MRAHRAITIAGLSILFLLASCDGAGMLDASDAQNRRWSGPFPLESQEGIANGKIALADDGLGFAVWASAPNVSADSRVYASREQSDGNWTDPVIIDDRDGDPSGPLLSLQANGNATVVWTEVEGDGTGQRIYANNFDRQTGWAGPVQLSNREFQEHPYLAGNAQGRVVVVWEANELFGTSIVTNRFDPQTGWGTSEIIDPAFVSSAFPKAAMNADGNAIAAWSDDFESGELNDAVIASRFSQDSGWDPARAVSDRQRSVSVQAVSTDSNGQFVLIWSQFEGAAFTRLVASQSSEAGGWSDPQAIGFDDGEGWIADIAADAQGRLIAVGSHPTGDEMGDVFALHRSADGVWGDPIILDNEDGWARFPSVDMSADGTAIAIWRQFDGVEDSVYAALYSPASGWAAPRLLETATTNEPRGISIGSTDISMNANGKAIAIWSQFDGSGYSLFANRYE